MEPGFTTPRRSPRTRARALSTASVSGPGSGPGHTPFRAGWASVPSSPSPNSRCCCQCQDLCNCDVFPKTDYTYSPMSSFHREISPGVMTLPNMSRHGLHGSNSFHRDIVPSQITPLRLNYSDNFGSDSDEVDDGIPTSYRVNRYYIHQQEHSSIWTRVRNVFLTSVISILTFTSSIVKSIIDRGYSIFIHKKRPAHVPSPPRFYSYNQQQSAIARIWSSFHEFFSKSYHWTSHNFFFTSAKSSWGSKTTSRHKRYKWLLPFFLLVPFLIFLGWWCWEDDLLSSAKEKIQPHLESAGYWMWSIITYPFHILQSFSSQIWSGASAIIFAPFSLLPSFEGLGAIVYDICAAPLRLLLSIFDLLLSFGWSVVSLSQMIVAPLLNLKLNFWDSPSEHRTLGSQQFYMSSESQSDALQTLLSSALHQHEVSLLNKLSESEHKLRTDFLSEMAAHYETLRAELAAKEGYGQQLNAKVAYLQDEIRRLRRRSVMCCRRSDAITPDAMRDKIWEELKKLLSGPEGLVLLGAAIAHVSPVDKTPANIPQFNDTEIRAWVTSVFLDKDDFEKKLSNMTRYFNEELERRSAMMMAASTEEINERIARQSQIHFAQMSKLQSELSGTYHYHDHHERGATFSSGETATSVDESRIRRVVDAALALYDADKTGMADYALESQGGQVVSTRCTETYQVKSPTLSVFGVPLWYPSNSPRTVIQPGMHPGECWAFVGSQGYLVIQLSHRIRVKGFTYEHIAPVLLPTGKMDSAPKEFSIYGLRVEGDNDPILLGNYHYLQNSTSMQYFAVQRSNVQPLQLIEIQVKSNHGNINYTCMYRFRVHGAIA